MDVGSIIRHLDFDLVFFQAEDGIRDLVRSRGLGDVYKRQPLYSHGLVSAYSSLFMRLLVFWKRLLTPQSNTTPPARYAPVSFRQSASQPTLQQSRLFGGSIVFSLGQGITQANVAMSWLITVVVLMSLIGYKLVRRSSPSS